MKSLVIAFIVLVLSLSSAPAWASGLPEEARERIDYLIGTWDVYDEALDEDGNVTSTTHAITITEYFLGDTVLVTTVIPDDGPVRKTIRFYDIAKGIF